MTAGIDPISNPVGFLLLYFVAGVMNEGFLVSLKLALISSLIAYPFIFLGRKVLDYVKKEYASGHLKSLFAATLLTLFVFWFILRLWYVVFSGSAFFPTGVLTFIFGMIVSFAIVFLLVLCGDFLLKKFYERYKMPAPVAIYTFDLVMCFAFWAVIFAYYTWRLSSL
jgi:hypothetical protein